MTTTQAPLQEVVLNYRPRKWAVRVLHGPDDAPNFKRGSAIVIHRRGGKTTAEINKHVRYAIDDDLEARRLRALQPAFTDKDVQELLHGREYAHIFPVLKQGKAVAWPKLKYATQGIRGAKPNETELSVSIPAPPRRVTSVGATAPGAPAQLGVDPSRIVRICGGDNADALRGPALSGAAYDEYQDHNPYLHNGVVSKSLADHLGYHDRLGTVKGKNQLYQAWKAARKEPDTWTSLWQDVDESLRTESGATLLAIQQALADERQEVAMGQMTEALFLQEWYLSVEAAIEGAIFGKEMSAVRQQGRIARGIFDPILPVDTDWDLGIADHMSIWCSQSLRTGEVRLIHAYSNQGEGFQHYFNYLGDLRARLGFVWGKHYPPHDIQVRELSTGVSRRVTAKAMGFTFEDPLPAVALSESINATRLLFPRCWFDEEQTEMGREALSQYRWKKNETTNEYTKDPLHDWASHYAAAFRGLAMRHQVPKDAKDDGGDRPYEGSFVAGEDNTVWMG